MKMKEFGPPGGGRASLVPPLDPPLINLDTLLKLSNTDTEIKEIKAYPKDFVLTRRQGLSSEVRLESCTRGLRLCTETLCEQNDGQTALKTLPSGNFIGGW